MSTITFDFRHYYQKGERRESDQIAYQWDLGHVAEIYVPATAAYEIHYCFADYPQTEDYAVESTTAAEDGGYKLTAHIPNKFFERSGELRVYVIGSDDNHILTTYEGYISIRGRIKPEDYTDDDPENGAETIIARARRYALESEAWADGQEEGADVPSTAPQYHNNAKYYAEQSAAAIDAAETAVEAAATASSKASEAASSATAAAQSAAAAAAAQADIETILGNFATYQATLIADQAYKVGEYLTYNKLLYRVTTAIASGGTITPGTNVVQTTVGDEVSNTCLRFENVSVTATTGDIATITDARITADHVLADCVWGNASAITSDVTYTTSAGSMVLNGTCTAGTTVTVTLVKKCN